MSKCQRIGTVPFFPLFVKKSKLFASLSSSSSSPSPSTSASTSTQSSEIPFKVFCDLDGVLVDFGEGVRLICGARPEEIPTSRMWSMLSKHNDFYTHLPWMKGGRQLWEAIRPLQPDILTGVPRNVKARTEKASWCQRELGIPTNHVDMAGQKNAHQIVSGRKVAGMTNVITCWSKNKWFEARHRAVLIDDRKDLGLLWEQAGGIFIHHTPGHVEPTLAKLKEHGILPYTITSHLDVPLSSPSSSPEYDLPHDTP
jgi:hypothetical protein